MKKVGCFPDRSWDRFLMDFGAILAPSWDPKWSQNRYKMVLKNNEKIVKNRMAKKSDTGGHRRRFGVPVPVGDWPGLGGVSLALETW